MGVVGCFHLAALYFMKTNEKRNILLASTKVGLIVRTLMFPFFAWPPVDTTRIQLFGLPAFITSMLSSYILGALSRISQSKVQEQENH